MYHSRALNPKRPGLLGQLDTRGGGGESSHFGKRSLKPLNFYFRLTNSVSYKSWHIQLKFDTLLRLLSLKLQPWEVAEVARVQAKKSLIKNFEICILSYTNVIHLRRKLRTIVIQIWNIIRGFCYEKFEKKTILRFSIPKNHNPLSACLGWISGKPVKIVKKWLDFLLVGIIMDKVKNFCCLSIILWEMAGNLLTNGQVPPPPPGSFRVKSPGTKQN